MKKILIFFSFISLFFLSLNANQSSENYLIIAVHAKHLDYTDVGSLIKSMMKKKQSNGLFGHAWIYLHGVVGAKHIVIEGGHTGEFGLSQPTYLDGVMGAMRKGEKDPIKYLWIAQKDGGFQKGSGGFSPTYAVRIDLTAEQFQKILMFIDPLHYDYKNFSIIGNQCSSFVARVASIAGLPLDSEITIPIQKCIKFGRHSYNLWENHFYCSITISTPDIIEKSLMRAVKERRVEVWHKFP